MVHDFLLSALVCPRCRGALASKSGHLNCGACRLKFPEFSGIPWVFAYPEETWVDWRQRCDFQVQTMNSEIHQIQTILAGGSVGSLGRQRLSSLQAALTHNRQVLSETVRPLLTGAGPKLELYQSVKSDLPLSQKLMGYYANLVRDWSWGEAEHQAEREILLQLLGTERKMGRVLVLGAGAGRLAWEIAACGQAELVVALDINPLLLGFARRMTSGETIDYFEIPIAPRAISEIAVKRQCRAPKAAGDNLLWLFADGMNPPFAAEAFDTVLTPWFIDVVPQDLKSLGLWINWLLKKGGRWLNLGPFGFLQAPLAQQYSAEEVLEIVGGCGFSPALAQRRQVPYLNSPASCQGRTEEILAFSAAKLENLAHPATFRHYPEWLADSTLKIPSVERFQRVRLATEIQSQILGQIDGRTSLDDLAQAAAARHQLSLEEARAAVTTLLRQLWDGT